MNSTPIIVLEVVGIVVILVVALVGVLLLLGFVRRLQDGKGPMGSVLQQSRELARENVGVARERLQVEKELLAAQKETNELLKQIVTRLEKKT
jgi:hypothetical protein